MLLTGAAPPGGGRSEVTPRFVRHFNVFCVPRASTSAMQLIFSSMLKVLRSASSRESVPNGGRALSALYPLSNSSNMLLALEEWVLH